MKLKYLLRGIGIGAVLATVIVYFMYGKSDKALSDDDIMARARELGMMTVSEFQDKELNSLKDKLHEASEIRQDEKKETVDDKDKSPDVKNTPSYEGGKTGSSTSEGNKAGKATDKERDKAGASKEGNTETKQLNTESAKDGSAQDDKTEATDSGNGSAQDGNAKSGNTEDTKVTPKLKVEEPKQQETKVTSSKVNFSITAGMSSEKVAAALKTLGVVDNSTEFNKYLVKNGYADKIKVGSFELQKGQSYFEIASKLTK